MKSKVLACNNHSQNHHTSVTINGTVNSSAGNNRTRTSTSNRYHNSKYQSMSVATKPGNRDSDICNNNNDEVVIDTDCVVNNHQSIIIVDSLNNNNTVEMKSVDFEFEEVATNITHLSIDSTGFVDPNTCNHDGNRSLSNDESNYNTDNSLEPESTNVNTDEDSQRSQESILENRTNLIVNYLPQNMSQEEMLNLFSNIGMVESCKLIRDKTTGQSLSYGFVNYQDPKDATNAIQRFNGLRLQNKMIKVSLARPSSETIKGANLYICGLPKSMSQCELEQLFSQYGTIITCRILSDSVTGNSKGVAFIRFDQRQEAETAIKKLNGHTPPNGTEPITVKLANTPFNINNSSNNPPLAMPQSQNNNNNNSNNEYCTTSPNHHHSVSIPPPSTNGVRCMMPNMRPMATTCPDIIPRLDVVLQNNGHRSPGVMASDYGQSNGPSMSNNHQIPFPPPQMVCPTQMHPLATFPMSYSGMAHPCLQPMGGPPGPSTVQSNSLVPVNGNHPTSQYLSIDPISAAAAHMIDPNLCCLFVYNLNADTKESTLWQTFGPYGAVHSVSVPRDPVTGKCTGFGYVTMRNYHEAILAAAQLNGNSIENQILQVAMNPSLKLSARNQYVLPSVAP